MTREEREWIRLPPGACAAGAVVRQDEPEDVLAIVVVETGSGRSATRICRLLPQEDVRVAMEELGIDGEPVVFCTGKCASTKEEGSIPENRVIDSARSLEEKMRRLAKLCVGGAMQAAAPPPGKAQQSTSRPPNPATSDRKPKSAREGGVDPKVLKTVMKIASREHDPEDRSDMAQEIIEKAYKQGYIGGDGLAKHDATGVLRAIGKGLVSRKIRRRKKDAHIGRSLADSAAPGTMLPEDGQSSGRHHATPAATYQDARKDAKRRIEEFIGRAISKDDMAVLDRIDQCWVDSAKYDAAAKLLLRALEAAYAAYDYVVEAQDSFGGAARDDLRSLAIDFVSEWCSYLMDMTVLESVPLTEFPPNMDDIYGVHEGLALAISNLKKHRAERPRTRLGFIVLMVDRYDVFQIGRQLRPLELAAVAIFRGIELSTTGPVNPKKLLTCMPFDEVRRYVDKARARRPPPAELLPREHLSAPAYMKQDEADPQLWSLVASPPPARAVPVPEWFRKKEKWSDRL